MFQEFVTVEEISSHGLALAEKFFGLVIPMSAFFVIASAQRHDSVGLRRIGHDDDLSGGLAAAPDHFFSMGSKADGANGGHPGVGNRAAAHGKGALSILTSHAKIFAVRNVKRAKSFLE